MTVWIEVQITKCRCKVYTYYVVQININHTFKNTIAWTLTYLSSKKLPKDMTYFPTKVKQQSECVNITSN